MRFRRYGFLALLLAIFTAGGCPGNGDDSGEVSGQDEDGDGYTVGEGDCDDGDPGVNPGVEETWYDGEDADCSGGSDYDQDGDGHDSDAHGGDDCDDTSATAYPGATDTWYDGEDSDCGGNSDYDFDGDGYDTVFHGGDDCDDNVATTHPGAADAWYDGVDSDCGGNSDYDQDADGYDSEDHSGTDCDDLDPDVNPGETETWYDGEDTDCDGESDFDQDGDGYDSEDYSGTDCDDTVAAVYPGAPETCNERDDDCDGTDDLPDPTDGTMWYVDADGDGFGTTVEIGRRCEEPADASDVSTDCDDGDDTTYPGAAPVACDGRDNDCDPLTFEVGGGARIGATPYATIGDALAAATTGQTVSICEGTYAVSNLVVNAGIVVEGLGGAGYTVLDAQGAGTVLRILEDADPVTVRGLTLTGGAGFNDTVAVRGGGVYVYPWATVEFVDAVISDNTAWDGGGLYIGASAEVSLVRTDVRANAADGAPTVSFAGGVYLEEFAALVLEETDISFNEAEACGGVYAANDAVIEGDGDSYVNGNEATSLAGGGLCGSEGGAVISGITIGGNTTMNAGGGVWAHDLTLNDVVVSGNTSGLGGGGISAVGVLAFTRVTVTGNEGVHNGGGINSASSTTVLTLDHCLIQGNTATAFFADGGGVALYGGTLVSVDTDWGTGLNDNPPADVGFSEDGLTCNYTGVRSFTYDDGSGVGVCP